MQGPVSSWSPGLSPTLPSSKAPAPQEVALNIDLTMGLLKPQVAPELPTEQREKMPQHFFNISSKSAKSHPSPWTSLLQSPKAAHHSQNIPVSPSADMSFAKASYQCPIWQSTVSTPAQPHIPKVEPRCKEMPLLWITSSKKQLCVCRPRAAADLEWVRVWGNSSYEDLSQTSLWDLSNQGHQTG